MAIALPDSLSLDAVACGTQSLLDAVVSLSPGFLQPAESLIGNDVVSLLRLQVSAESVLRLGVSPSPCPGQACASAAAVCPAEARLVGACLHASSPLLPVINCGVACRAQTP